MSLDIKKKLENNAEDDSFPIDVLNDFANQLSAETDSLIKISINPYYGATESYVYNPLGLTVANILGAKNYNVQEDLGMIGNDYRTKYEFIIESPYLSDFRYRLLLVDYEIEGYPCKIVLEQGYADLINNVLNLNGYTYHVNNSKELSEMLLVIFNSDKFITFVKQIRAIVNRKKKLEESGVSNNISESEKE